MALSRVADDLARQLADLREAWEAQRRQDRDTTTAEARRGVEEEIAHRVEEAVSHARQAWDDAHAGLVARIREDADAQVARWEAETEAMTRALRDARQEWDAEVDARVRDAVSRARAAWDAEQTALLAASRQESDAEVARAVADARAEAERAERAALDELQAVSAAWTMTEQQLQAQLQVAEAQLADAVETLALAERAAFTRARENMKAGIVELLTAVERLDECTSLKATVDALGQSLVDLVPRAMVFLARGDDLKGWHLHGFTEAPDPLTITVPPSAAGQLAEVVATGRPRRIAAESLAGPLAFAAMRGSRWGLAAPVVLGHATVAVVYADDGGSPDRVSPAAWEELVQVITRHASRHLEALTAARSIRLSAAPRRTAAPVSGMLSGKPLEAPAGPV